MAPKFFETDKAKKLIADWDKKLKNSGFEDIEQRDENLKRWDSYFFKLKVKGNSVLQESKEIYFRLAGQFLYENAFESVEERRIWEMHCNGVSMRGIVSALKKKGHKSYKFKVQTTIERLADKMLKRHHENG